MIANKQNKKSIFAFAVLALLTLSVAAEWAMPAYAQATESFRIIQPKNNSAFISDVLFVSWEKVASAFRLNLSKEGAAIESILTENAFYQFSGLAPGNYTIQAAAISGDKETQKSEKVNVLLKSVPEFSITINTSGYQETKAVRFHINAPTGCELSMNVSSATVFIPYETKNLVAKTITIYLEPDFYWMNAGIFCDGIRQTFYDTFILDEHTGSHKVKPIESEKDPGKDEEIDEEKEEETEQTVRLNVAVKDSKGRGIRAVIRLKSDKTTITKVSTDEGDALFVLAPGVYALSADANGFRPESQNITLSSDKNILVELEKTIEPEEEEMPELDDEEQVIETEEVSVKAGREITLIEPAGTFFEDQGVPIRYRTDGVFESCRVNLITEGLPGFRTLVNNQNVRGEVAFIEDGISAGRYRAYVRCSHQGRTFESNYLSFSVIHEIEELELAKDILARLEKILSQVNKLGEQEKAILSKEGITNILNHSTSRLKSITSSIMDEKTSLTEIESLTREMKREIENAETRAPIEITYQMLESKIISAGRSSIKDNIVISDFIESRLGSKSDVAIDSVVYETNSRLILRETSRLAVRYKDYTREICIERFSSDKSLERSYVLIEGDAKSLEHNIIKGINSVEKDVFTAYADCQRIGKVELFSIGEFEESRNFITAAIIGLASLGTSLWILVSLIIVGAAVVANYAVRVSGAGKLKGMTLKGMTPKPALHQKTARQQAAQQPLAIVPDYMQKPARENLEEQLLNALEQLYLELHSGAVKTKRIHSYFELIGVIPKEIKTKYSSIIEKIQEKVQEKDFEHKFNQVMGSIRTIDLSKLDEIKKMELGRMVSDLISDYSLLSQESQGSLSSLMQRIDSLTRIIR